MDLNVNFSIPSDRNDYEVKHRHRISKCNAIFSKHRKHYRKEDNMVKVNIYVCCKFPITDLGV